MNEDNPLLFDLPAVARKKVGASFDGGPDHDRRSASCRLAQAERRLGIAETSAMRTGIRHERPRRPHRVDAPVRRQSATTLNKNG